jgi:uncharacterized membrane protein AbrB (regulator of aidB expression)
LNEYLGMMIWQANSVTLVSTMNNDWPIIVIVVVVMIVVIIINF